MQKKRLPLTRKIAYLYLFKYSHTLTGRNLKTFARILFYAP